MRLTELYKLSVAEHAYFRGKRAVSCGDLEGAISYFVRAIRYGPTTTRARYELHEELAALLEAIGRKREAVPHLQALVDVFVDDVDLLKRLALLIDQTDGPESAIAAWRQVLASKQDDRDAHSRLAILLQDVGRSREAVQHLRALTGNRPADIRELKRLARLTDETSGGEEAIDAWRQVLVVFQDDIDAHKRLAKLLQAACRKEEALPHLKAIVAASKPGQVKALRRLARLLQETSRRDEAIDAWKQVLTSDPGDMEAHRRMANLLQAAGRKNEALSHLRVVTSNSSDPRLLRRLALLCGEIRSEEEIAAWERVLEVDAEDLDAHRRLTKLLLAAGRKEEALPHYRAMVIAGHSADPNAWRGLARLIDETKGEEESVSAWKQVLAHAPEDQESHTRLAALLLTAGREREAEPHFQVILAGVKSGQVKTLQRLARMIDGERAITAWKAIIAVVPGDIEAHARLAGLLRRSGRNDEANSHLQAAFAGINKHDVKALRQLARLIERTSDAEQAIAAWRYVLTVDSKRDAETHARLVSLLLRAGRTPEAVSHVQMMVGAGELDDVLASSLLSEVVRYLSESAENDAACQLLLKHMIIQGPPSLGILAVQAFANFAGSEVMLRRLLASSEALSKPQVARAVSRHLMCVGRFEEAARLNAQLSLIGGDDLRFPERLSNLAAKISKRRRAPQSGNVGALGDHSPCIIGVPFSGALGDLTMQLVFLASAKLHFRNSRLVVITRHMSDGAMAAIECCPYIDEHVIVDQACFSEVVTERSKAATITFAHDIRGPQIHKIQHLALEFYEFTAPFVIPQVKRDSLHREFVKRGVDPDRWVVAMHCRHNASYRWGHFTDFVRDASPHTFGQLADYVIEELGGQVIFLGHPGMPRPRERTGLFWFGDAPVLLQNYAIARSRYFVGCDSGPVMTASAFQVPTLKSNSIYSSGAWNKHDIMLPKNILTADCSVVSFSTLWNETHGHLLRDIHSFDDFFIVDNSFRQLQHCVDKLHQQTVGLNGLRALQSPVGYLHSHQEFMMRVRGPSAQFIDLSHLLGRPVISAADLLRMPATLDTSHLKAEPEVRGIGRFESKSSC